MYGKMKIRDFPRFILLILTNVFMVSCLEKGSLTFVIDNTRSMRNDINQVKQSADAITKIVFEEKASQIKNMILITFNDPYAKLVIDTESRDDLQKHIKNITVSNPYGNWDCEEPSLKGLLMGLEKSRPGSFIYAFTDASAKDYWNGNKVKDLCQKKQSQVTFVLTGHCYGRTEKDFQVYYDIATACSGLAFYVSKKDVSQVLATVKESISGNKTVLTAVKAPPYKFTNIPFVIDDQTEYAIVTVSGSSVSLTVSGPRARQENIMWLTNAKVIKLIDPTPGQYIARVSGHTESSVYIVGRTDFLFSHGFSALEPKSISDTTPQPIANAKTHLSITVTDKKHTVNILSAQILDMNEKVLYVLPLRKVATDFYTTESFVAPSKRFKVAVTGKALRTGKEIRRIAKIPITPQDPPKPKSKRPIVTISEGQTTEVEYGATVKLTCKVSAYPEPQIIWKNSRKTTLVSQSSVFELPYNYISYLTITDVVKPETYTCSGENNKGTEFKKIEVIVKEPFTVKPTTISGTKEFKYGEKATLLCDITASVPMHIVWSYEDKTGTSKNIVKSNNYQISGDGKQLTINKMDVDMAGKYSCKALLDKDPKKFVVFSTQVNISGLVKPTVTGSGGPTKTISKGSNVAIECRVSGVPKPTITWQFMAKDNTKFVPVAGSKNVYSISNVNEKHAGRYKCVAHNAAGDAEYTTDLTVQVLPKVTGVTAETKTKKGSNVAIECHVSGIPKPTISWQFQSINNTNFVSVPGSSNVLHLSNVDEDDTGRYKCLASNVLGTSDHVTTLTVHVPPVITAGVAAQTALKGSKVVIECNVYGIPKPTITWLFMAKGDSNFVSIPGSNDALRISSVDEKHAGSYKCDVHNIVGDAKHVTVLTVQALPTVTGVASKTTPEGSSVDIECKVYGLPQPAITWQFMAKDDSKFVSIPGSDSVLRISNVDEKHAGRYKCVAHNSVGDAEHITTLTVQVKPKVIDVAPETTSKKGSDVTIKCHVSGVPKPTITWQFKAEGDTKFMPIPGSDDVLRISSVAEKHAGSYKCVAHNALGDVEHVTTLNVQVAPKVTGAATQITSEGSNVVIECNVSGSPRPTISWQYMSELGTSFVPIAGSDKVLRISNVEEKQSGRYKCVAHNIVGDAEHITALTVQVLPKVIDDVTPEIIHQKGSNVDINCHVSGVPKPTITWQYKAEGDTKFVPIAGSDDVLRISSVDAKHAGSYKCVAHNVLGDVEHVTTLTVQAPPQILSSIPNVYKSVEGKDAQLKIPCTVSGLPKPVITWKVNGATISQSEKYSIEDGALVIKNPIVGDSQIYTCEATNLLGSVKANFEVKIYQVPKVPSRETTQQVINGSPVTIECAIFDGVPKPTVTWQYMETNGKKFVSLPLSDHILRLLDVGVKHSGRYKCIARNDVGVAEHITTLIVQEAPKITGTKEIVVNAGTSVDIECKIVNGVPAPTLTWEFKGNSDSNFSPLSGTEKVLHISEIQRKSAGSYKCIAHNIVGSAEHVTTLHVKFAPVILTKKDSTFEGLIGDVALRIPCNATGEPKPTVTWKIGEVKIVPNERISIIDGALVIKDPKESDTNSYTCEVKNELGSTEETFTAVVHTVLNDADKFEDVNILYGTSKKIECGSNNPTQKIRWFNELEELTTKENFIQFTNADYDATGNYSCRVSDMNGAYTITYVVLVGSSPVFSFEQVDPAFDWHGSDTENDLLDCQAETAGPPVDVIWTYNGKVLEGKNNMFLSVDGNWGHYTCNVSNVHGAIQKSFDVVSSYCLIKRKPTNGHIMPLILNQNYTWPVLDSTEDYLSIEPRSPITFFCPSLKGVKNKLINSFKKLPTVNEINAICDKQDTFTVNGKPHKLSDFDCSREIEPIVINTHERCLTETSELIRVGFDVHGFLETYEICFDKSKNIPLYTRVLMSGSNQGRKVTQSWHKYPGIGAGKSGEGYTCADATSSCCYAKTQLVNARDFSDGPAQRSTYIDPLNAIPYWRPCEKLEDPWSNIESMIRMQFSEYPQFVVWSGIHTLQEKNGLNVPRYLWKVVKFDEEDSIAVVYVNDPSFSKSEDVLCKNICVDDNVSWMRDIDERTYCCKIDEFLNTFGLYDTSIAEATTNFRIDKRMKAL